MGLYQNCHLARLTPHLGTICWIQIQFLIDIRVLSVTILLKNGKRRYVKPMLHEQVSRIKDMRFPRHLSVNCMACASFFHEGNLYRENRGNLSTGFIHC